MKYKIDSKTKKYTAFLTDVAGLLEKYDVKDLLVVANVNGQIRNTYLPVTGVEDPLFCNISDGIHGWLQMSGNAKRDKTSFAIGNDQEAADEMYSRKYFPLDERLKKIDLIADSVDIEYCKKYDRALQLAEAEILECKKATL